MYNTNRKYYLINHMHSSALTAAFVVTVGLDETDVPSYKKALLSQR